MIKTTDVPRQCRNELHSRFFGDFAVLANGHEITRWRAGRSRALFQFMARNRGLNLTSDGLVSTLWHGTTTTPCDSALKVAVHGMRATMAEYGLGREVVRRVDGGYRFEPDSFDSDVDDFERHLTRATSELTTGDGVTGIRLLEKGLSHYRGEFLPGEHSPWAQQEREYFRNRVVWALCVLRDTAEREGDITGLGRISHQIMSIESHHEPTYRSLMRAHALRGEWTAVRRWYDLCVHGLRTELGVDAEPATHRLRDVLLTDKHRARVPVGLSESTGSVRRPAAVLSGAVA